MQALVYQTDDPDGPPRWRSDVPVPQPSDQELLVRVHAVGLNRADMQRRAAFYGGPSGSLHIAGLEMAGEVVEIGKSVTRHRVGDRVMAAVGSACADYVAVHECMACPVPAGFSWVKAAATYVCLSTAYDALCCHAKLRRDEAVLVQGATSGVGIAAVQLARAFGARRVAGTSRSHDKLQKLQPYGLDQAILHDDMPGDMRGSFDVIVDLIGSSAAASSLVALAYGGRWVSVGRVSAEPALVDMGVLAHKEGTLIGLASRTRSMQRHGAVIDAFVQATYGLLESGAVFPVIDRVFAGPDTADAFAYSQRARHFGKIVLSLHPE